MKILFLGATQFSLDILNLLLEHKINIDRIFSIPREFSISYSKGKVKNYNYADLSHFANTNTIDYEEIEAGEGKKLSAFYDELAIMQPDLILVMGWYYMVPKKIRALARYGAWAIHASLLPKYAGGAPLVWAMINGEKQTGVTLFRLADGVDDGDIIAQEAISIEPHETIKEVYAKASQASKRILLKALQEISTVTFTPQDKSSIERWPQRNPEDGEIDLSWPAERIHNFIRAQSTPYPGAFIRTTDGKKIIIEKASIAWTEEK